MNRRSEPALIEVEPCFVQGASTAREAVEASREMNMSDELNVIRETFRLRVLTAFRWSGDECSLVFDEIAIKLKANLGGIGLNRADWIISIDSLADSPDRWILRFRCEKTFEVDWSPRDELSDCLHRELTRIDKSDFGYWIKFQSLEPILFSPLRVVTSNIKLPRSIVYFSAGNNQIRT
jgi:hypothetical protein